MLSPIDQLKERIFKNKKGTELTNILGMIREFSCLGEIIGRDFEIRNPEGKLVYKIHQKPIAIKQLNVLLKEFINLKKLDDEREATKWGNKKGGIKK